MWISLVQKHFVVWNRWKKLWSPTTFTCAIIQTANYNIRQNCLATLCLLSTPARLPRPTVLILFTFFCAAIICVVADSHTINVVCAINTRLHFLAPSKYRKLQHNFMDDRLGQLVPVTIKSSSWFGHHIHSFHFHYLFSYLLYFSQKPKPFLFTRSHNCWALCNHHLRDIFTYLLLNHIIDSRLSNQIHL